MARQVQVLVICDWCNSKWREDDEEVPLDREWSWEGNARVLQLCGLCRDKVREFLKPLYEVSEQKRKHAATRRYNRTTEPQAARWYYDSLRTADGLYPCPAPGCSRSFNGPQHLGNHHSRKHGSRLTENTYVKPTAAAAAESVPAH